MARTSKKTTVMKKEFVKNLIKTGHNKTEAYKKTFPNVTSRGYAAVAGGRLFKDPEVQDIYKNQGIDTLYLAKRTKELMDSENEAIASRHVQQFNKALLDDRTTQRVESVSVNLFGDLNDAEVQRIRKGRKITGETEGAGEDSTD